MVGWRIATGLRPVRGSCGARRCRAVTPSVSTSRRRSGHLGQLAGGSVVGWVVGGVVDPAAPEHPDPGVGQDPDRVRVVGAAGDGGTRGGVRGRKSRTSWPDRVCGLGVAWQAVRRQRGADVVWRCMTSTPSSPCLGIRLSDDKAARLDAKALTLARLAALVAVGASCVCYGWAVGQPWPPTRRSTRSSAS